MRYITGTREFNIEEPTVVTLGKFEMCIRDSINSEVQKELSEIISRELKDPRIHPMTTVVSVEVTPDLKFCKAYISVLGSEEAGKDTVCLLYTSRLCFTASTEP